jgi:hypothetical protein
MSERKQSFIINWIEQDRSPSTHHKACELSSILTFRISFLQNKSRSLNFYLGFFREISQSASYCCFCNWLLPPAPQEDSMTDSFFPYLSEFQVLIGKGGMSAHHQQHQQFLMPLIRVSSPLLQRRFRGAIIWLS